MTLDTSIRRPSPWTDFPSPSFFQSRDPRWARLGLRLLNGQITCLLLIVALMILVPLFFWHSKAEEENPQENPSLAMVTE